MNPFKTAILGFDRHGSGMHFKEIAENPAFALTAVCDGDPEQLVKAPDSVRTYRQYQDMLQAEDPDLVLIATRSDQHCQMTCDLAYLQKHLTEKTIGKAFMIRLVVSNFSTRDDWQIHKQYGGGYLLNWGPHLVLKAVQVAGGLHEVQSVCGFMRNVMHPGDAEDIFSAMLKMRDGTLVCVERTIAPLEHSLWVIQADRGMITLRDTEATVIRATPRRPADPTATTQPAAEDKSEQNESIAAKDLYGNTHEIYEALAAAMRGEKDFPVTCDDALQLTRILDAIRDAAESNRVIELK